MGIKTPFEKEAKGNSKPIFQISQPEALHYLTVLIILPEAVERKHNWPPYITEQSEVSFTFINFKLSCSCFICPLTRSNRSLTAAAKETTLLISFT